MTIVVASPEMEDIKDVPYSALFWRDVILTCVLLIIGGISSGLMIGLMSINERKLKAVKRNNVLPESNYAKILLPLIKNKNLLMVTLMLSLMVCLEATPLFLMRIFDIPWIVLAITIPAFLVFGQVLPGAVFSRWRLTLGYFFSPFMWFILVILSPLAWPISKVVGKLYGDKGQGWGRNPDLKELVQLSKQTAPASDMSGAEDEHETLQTHLEDDEVAVIIGAINMKEKRVEDAMTPLGKTYMLSDDAKLGPDVLDEIIEHGHTRIPVYHGQRGMIIGMILTKPLIKFNPADHTPIDNLEVLPLPRVSTDMSLHKLLNQFKTGKSQMAVVLDASDLITPIGIITLEDVFEVLIENPIFSESEVKRKYKRKEHLSAREGLLVGEFEEMNNKETSPLITDNVKKMTQFYTNE